ncbi:MAG: hypothetical protein M1835_002220 [Candelina submexicana]|nr:MAG: hypothetical protein M1835_002220 [Candelina submexicana]
MAVEAPDPKTLKSWEDAFQYPIPVVRRMEQQLRSDLVANSEKLRTLVGASFRDLLGTAERIIEMDGQMEVVETNLGDMGRKCNSRVLERIERNNEQWNGERKAQDRVRYIFGSQLAILQSCPLAISRILRKGRSLLLAAKILVISRLLHKTLSQVKDPPPLLETIRNRLASLRRRLLARVDHQFSNPSVNLAVLLEAMCALSLAYSSTSTDILRHFHHVRLGAMTAQLERADGEHGDIVEVLQLYVRTLQDTHAIFPKRLPESLARLKEQPIIADPEVRSVAELNLGIHERWVAEDVRNFTPWVRHDDLQKSVAEKLLKEWAVSAFKSFVAGLKGILASLADFDQIVHVRRQVLEMWLSSRNRIPKALVSEGLEGLRSVINARLTDIIHNCSSHLQLVGTKIASEIGKARPNNTPQSMWDDSMTSMDINDGAMDFRQAILQRTHGTDESVQRVIGVLGTSLQFFAESEAVIRALREARWAEDLEYDGDEDFESDSRYPELTEDDPQALELELDRSVAQGLSALEAEIQTLAHGVKSAQEGQQAVFLLRVLRMTRRRLPRMNKREELAQSIIPELHATVAESVSIQPLRRFNRAVRKSERDRRAPARALWEGMPPIPVQPSPAVFELLHELVSSMVESGADVWSTAGTQAVKTTVKHKVAECLNIAMAPRMVNGHHPGAEGESASQDDAESTNGAPSHEEERARRSSSSASDDWKVQLVFDVLFLQRALATSQSEDSPEVLAALEHSFVDEMVLEVQLHERLRKSSQEYWKKTYLLFGLLA